MSEPFGSLFEERFSTFFYEKTSLSAEKIISNLLSLPEISDLSKPCSVVIELCESYS